MNRFRVSPLETKTNVIVLRPSRHAQRFPNCPVNQGEFLRFNPNVCVLERLITINPLRTDTDYSEKSLGYRYRIGT